LSQRSEPKGSSPAFDFPKGWCAYLLIREDGSYYTGSAADLGQRIADHANGKGSGYTKTSRPVILAWYEPHTDQAAAQARESQIKGWSRSKKDQLSRGSFPNFRFGHRPWPRLNRTKNTSATSIARNT
jgi:putative endonuclease